MAFRFTVMIHMAMYFLNSPDIARSCTSSNTPPSALEGPDKHQTRVEIMPSATGYLVCAGLADQSSFWTCLRVCIQSKWGSFDLHWACFPAN